MQVLQGGKATLQVGDQVRIVSTHNTWYASDLWRGKIGVIKSILTPEQAEERTGSRDATHVVALQEWEPEIVVGAGSIKTNQPLDAEGLARVEASGESFEIDEGVREYFMDPRDLKLLRDSQVSFWQLYHERKQAHQGEVRRRANRACNLWRCHKEEKAAELARSSHPMNLLLSAMDSPPNFKGPRLHLDKSVELCRAAGKDEQQLADILFHMYFENRDVEEVEGLLPRCTCTLN